MKFLAFIAVLILSTAAAGICTETGSLASAAGIRLGGDISRETYRRDCRDLSGVSSRFNIVVAENEFSFGTLRSKEDGYSWEAADALVGFAETFGLAVRVQDFLGGEIPEWVGKKQWTRASLFLALKCHIGEVFSRYRGRVVEWDLVSDVFFLDTLRHRFEYASSFWFDIIGQDYIDSAFVWANKADPATSLFYSGGGIVSWNDNSDLIAAWAELKHKHVPLAGVAFRASPRDIGSSQAPMFRENIYRFTRTGLKASITHVALFSAQDTAGAGSYGEVLDSLLSACIENPNCGTFTAMSFSETYQGNADIRFPPGVISILDGEKTGISGGKSGAVVPARFLLPAGKFDILGRVSNNSAPLVRLAR